MIDVDALQTRIVLGLREHLQPLGVTAIIERDQNAPAPPHPFVGFKWTSITPEPGSLRRTRAVVPAQDPKWAHDVQYTYVRTPVMTLSVTVFDRDGAQIHGITQAAHDWCSIPQLGGDCLQPTGAVIVEVTPISARDTEVDA